MDTLLTHLNSGAAVVVVLGLCLLFHETGHFLVAKLCRMRVEEFAMGFGRALVSWQSGETAYRINLFPVGGYVKIAGMEPGADNVERGFHSRPRWQGALVILAGSVANVVLATLLFTAVAAWQGIPDPTDQGIYIGKVSRHSPAQQAGLRARDQVVAVDGQDTSLEVKVVGPGLAQQAGMKPDYIVSKVGGVEVNTPGELVAALRSAPATGARVTVLDPNAASLTEQEKVLTLPVPPMTRQSRPESAVQLLRQAYNLQFAPLSQSTLVGYIAARPNERVNLTVNRAGQSVTLQAVPAASYARTAARDKHGTLYSQMRAIGRIGVVLRGATRPVGAVQAIELGFDRTVGSVALVVFSMRAMIRHEVKATELAGPVGIMAMSAERARVGWDAVLGFGGLISANLAFVNLFPFPPFDGFKVVLLAFEATIRRRINARIELVMSIIGFVAVIFLFVALTAKDVTNLVLYGTP